VGRASVNTLSLNPISVTRSIGLSAEKNFFTAVFTDGEDLNSRVPEQAAEQRLEASDVVLYPIGQGRAPKLEALKRVLERLAQKSGGRAFFENLDELDGVFSKIVEELSNQYLLGYPRPDSVNDGRWRKIRVEIPGRNVKVRTRQGYRVLGK
jgi:VWFA-related protein